MKTYSKTISIKTKNAFEYIDITEKVEQLLKKSKIINGMIVVFSKHTTLAIRINEKENGFFGDFKEFFSNLLPKSKYYQHNDLKIRTENLVCSPGATDCLNGHSHCQTMLLNTSETIPVADGKICLGVWQRVLALELDESRDREILIHIMGE